MISTAGDKKNSKSEQRRQRRTGRPARNPYDKSEAEIQRFCQSYMTELAKYVGPDLDQPTMGMGVGEKEFGYLFGQYKRINIKSSSGGNPFLSARNVKVSVHIAIDAEASFAR